MTPNPESRSMRQRTLEPFKPGFPTLERYSYEQRGQCGACLRPVLKIHGSNIASNVSGVRYATPEDRQGWSMFRCETCSSVIDETWIAA